MPASTDTDVPDAPPVTALLDRVPRVGVFSWSFVGLVLAASIVSSSGASGRRWPPAWSSSASSP